MLYKVSDLQADLFELVMKENGIDFEAVDEENYADVCPECGDGEFWHYGHCSHCGYDL